MKRTVLALSIAVLVACPAFATYTPINPATSGSEIDLWVALELVARDPGGPYWTSTAFLNAGAGGRRVDDDADQVWADSGTARRLGRTVTVSMSALFWGGLAYPNDTLGQELIYDDTAYDGTVEISPVPPVDDFGDTGTFTPTDFGYFLFGDGSTNPTAWSLPGLNSPFSDGEYDRMVAFDVSGFDIYGWDSTANDYVLVYANAPEDSYILGFDPGTDHDYQDMIVFVEGCQPGPPCVEDLDCDDDNVCTVDTCGPTGVCVYSNAAAGTVCRPAVDDCDVEEACTGDSPDCPDDGVQPADTPCPDDGDECTSDICDGVSVVCTHPDNELCGACCIMGGGLREVGDCIDGVLEQTCIDQYGAFQGPGTTCNPIAACCLSDDATCEGYDPVCCLELGGTPLHEGSECEGEEACCTGAGDCYPADRVCCLANGDTPQGSGTTCTEPEACCFADNTCQMLDPVCCDDEGGTPQGAGTVCTEPEACCFPDGTCVMVDPLCCDDLGGTPQGAGTVCTEPEACCFPDGTCAMVDPLCCDDLGGTPQGAGTVCTEPEACCFPDGMCVMVDPLCCDDLGGTPQGAGTVCTEPEACCFPDATCAMVDPLCCDDLGGTPQGAGTVCTVPESCCFPDGTCAMVDPLCCDDLGGTPQGAGTVCTEPEACCFPDGTCVMVDPLCCDDLGGTPQGPGTVCTELEACCLEDDTCIMADPLCCAELGGTPQGAGTACTYPSACCLGDGTCVMVDPLCCEDLGGTSYVGDACGGLQGCCLPDADTCMAGCVTVDALCCVIEYEGTPMGPGTACGTDSDGDTIDDLCDICEGVDDAIFCPGCKDAIPTVSEWGLVILTLLLLVAGKVYFGFRRPVHN